MSVEVVKARQSYDLSDTWNDDKTLCITSRVELIDLMESGELVVDEWRKTLTRTPRR